ncbi:MAG: MaoC family dehydratase N-terminal domain-containing protein [Dehalococcoidia bacterium]|nr:MaoC family dehydratase N-terminal domain-containing protein [Dehalococcoidia bacterium]
MPAFVVTDSLKQLIGHKEGPIVFKVEEGAIQRYAQAVGDSNPLHSDIEYAAGSEWGRLMAPPGFTGWPVAKGFDMFKVVEKLIQAGAPVGLLDGGVEYDFLAPVGAGDTLVAVVNLASIEGRETKMGPTMVTTIETTYTNQRGIVVLIARNTFLNF